MLARGAAGGLLLLIREGEQLRPRASAARRSGDLAAEPVVRLAVSVVPARGVLWLFLMGAAGGAGAASEAV